MTAALTREEIEELVENLQSTVQNTPEYRYQDPRPLGTLKRHLPKGWRIRSDERAYSDHHAGQLIGPDGREYVSYFWKTAPYDYYLQLSVVPEPSPSPGQDENEQAMARLKEVMPAEVWHEYAAECEFILGGDGASRGYGKTLPLHVNAVLAWYRANQEQMAAFETGRFRGTPVGVKWQEFREMFVLHSDLDAVTRLAQAANQGVLPALVGKSLPATPALYQQWKAWTEEGRRPLGQHAETEECTVQ